MSWEIFEKALLDYNKPEVYEISHRFLQEQNGIAFIDEYIMKSLSSIGDKWENGEVALSQVYMSSRLCEELALSLLPESRFSDEKLPTIAILTLETYHTLGKRIVSAVVKSAGYNLKDYGTMTETEEIINRVIEDGIHILMISVLIYPSALKIKKISDSLRVRDPSVKILVGGAPFLMDSTLWIEVGADQMGKSAADSIAIIDHWVKEEL